MRMILLAVLTLGLASPAFADNDRPSHAEKNHVLAALRAAGCSNPSKIERDDGGFKAKHAHCRDGVYKVKLSRRYHIVKKERDGDD
ncbi:MAG: PepSY domain-containing protein [Pararhizobium sp.]